MSVNGVTSNQTAAAYNHSAVENVKAENTAAENTKNENTSNAADTGVIYEPSQESVSAAKPTYQPDTNLINKLKADAEQKTAQFRKMVESMLSKQNKVFQGADGMWKALAAGDFTVDKATALNAQKEIGEDGYWGVEQTSDRILSFAEALTGGDPEKMEKMREAFIKGYKQATGAWGRDLPDISSKTYDAVMKKFDEYNKKDDETEDTVTKKDPAEEL